MVTFRIESDLLRWGELEILVDFPYPDIQCDSSWSGDFNRVNSHRTVILRSSVGSRQADFLRQIDSVDYYVSIRYSRGGKPAMPADDRSHSFTIRCEGSSSLELECVFSAQPFAGRIDNSRTTIKKCTHHWQAFWKNGVGSLKEQLFIWLIM